LVVEGEEGDGGRKREEVGTASSISKRVKPPNFGEEEGGGGGVVIVVSCGGFDAILTSLCV
jgi:hypothetical protein